jgi:hypothetical protein
MFKVPSCNEVSDESKAILDILKKIPWKSLIFSPQKAILQTR